MNTKMKTLFVTRQNIDSQIKDSELTISQWDGLSSAINDLSRSQELEIRVGEEGLFICGKRNKKEN
jgi:hypothetical protein